MPPKRMVGRIPFPVRGLYEGGPYEDQPAGTTVDCQNVRAFPADSPDTASSLNSDSSGRARGGQRPGMSKYVGVAHTASTSIQDINHLAWTDLTPLSGDGHSIMQESSGGSYVLVNPDGTLQATAGVATETYQMAVWGSDGYAYIAVVDTDDKLIIRKINKLNTESWSWSDDDSPVFAFTSSPTRPVRGMVVWGKVIYLWCSQVNGINGEAMYRVSTSTGKLMETATGTGTEADLWKRSQKQSGGDFQDFYPSSGNTSGLVNPMIASRGLLGMLVFNNSGGAAETNTDTTAIQWNATAEDIQTALRALSHLDLSSVSCSGGPLGTSKVTVTFAGNMGKQDTAILTQTSSLTGGTLTISVDTAGNSDSDKQIGLTSDATGGTVILTHNGRLALQLMDIEQGKQTSATELQAYAVFGGGGAVKDTNRELDITADEFGNFYCLTAKGTTLTFGVTKQDQFNALKWQNENTSPTRSLAYEPTRGRLAAVGGNVYGSTHSFAIINASTGAKISSQDAHSITNWNVVDIDQLGGYRLFRNQVADSVARMTEAEIPVEDDDFGTPDHGGATQGGASCSAKYDLNPENSLSARKMAQVAVCGGIVKRFDNLEFITVTSGGDLTTPALRRDVPVIFSAQVGPNLFFADGRTQKYYDGKTNEMKTWTPTAGSFPVDADSNTPTLIENWRGRVVQSGVKKDPTEWFMTKMGDAFDFQYAPDTLTETQAVAGANAPVGKSPDVIRAIMPINDDILMFGCDHSIWMMSGDPMIGGRLDQLVEGIGTPFGRPWCQSSSRTFYVFGTRGGVYRATVGQQGFERITLGRMEERLNAIDLQENLINLAWNERENGVHVFVTPLSPAASSVEHYFYDVRQDGWWIDKFSKSDHDPKAVHIFDGDDVNDRVILLGGRDGFIRKWDPTADDDDGTAISSHVYLGPLAAGSVGAMQVDEIRCVLGKGSDDVTLSIYEGDCAEDAYNKTTAFYTGTFKAGRNLAERRRVVAHAVYCKLGNTTLDKTWALESMEYVAQSTSRSFARIF